MAHRTYRENAYALLRGDGLEIGAFHQPAQVPASCRVHYFDTLPTEKAAELFPEIPREQLVPVEFLGDLDNDGLAQFADARFDFVIINHVIEHLSNPVKTIREVFRITKPGGIAILSIPDKNHTYDQGRQPTKFEHLWQDYLDDTRVSDDAHYEDFLRSAGPHVFQEAPENLKNHIARARSRKEHAHVWTSETFATFLDEIFGRLQIVAERAYESRGTENQFEYFSAWRKRSGPADVKKP